VNWLISGLLLLDFKHSTAQWPLERSRVASGSHSVQECGGENLETLADQLTLRLLFGCAARQGLQGHPQGGLQGGGTYERLLGGS